MACTPLSTWGKADCKPRKKPLEVALAIPQQSFQNCYPKTGRFQLFSSNPSGSGGSDWEGFYDAHGGGTNDDKRKAGRVVVPAKFGGEACQLQDEMKVVLCDASPGDHRVVWDRMGHPWSAWEAAPQALGPAIALGSEAILGRRLAVKFVKD